MAEEYGRLVRLAGVICWQPADAQDAVQAALERALRNRGALRDPTRIVSWLSTIVVREAIRVAARRRTWLGRVSLTPREIDVVSEADDPASPRSLMALGIDGALAALPVEQRAALALHHYAGYSIAETAEILGVPIETARSRLRLARERLRRALTEATR